MKYDICESCLYRDGSLGMCDACDEGDQYEEDWADDGEEGDDEDSSYRIIPILEAA